MGYSHSYGLADAKSIIGAAGHTSRSITAIGIAPGWGAEVGLTVDALRQGYCGARLRCLCVIGKRQVI